MKQTSGDFQAFWNRQVPKQCGQFKQGGLLHQHHHAACLLKRCLFACFFLLLNKMGVPSQIISFDVLEQLGSIDMFFWAALVLSSNH